MSRALWNREVEGFVLIARSIPDDTRTFVLRRLLSPLLSGVLRAGLDLTLVLTVHDEADKYG